MTIRFDAFQITKTTFANFSLVTALMAGFFVMISIPSSSVACPKGIAKTTTYFLPHIKDYCKGNTICKSFKKAVQMQGSGRLHGGKVYRYNGKTSKMGNCSTTTGAAGSCLTPYISIAADPRYYRMGTIIEMEGLKGTIVELDDGRKIVHPGFLRVEDTGGAIKGKGRFDIFTGYKNPHHPDNNFGYDGDKQMSGKSVCATYKGFRVLGRKDRAWVEANLAIERALAKPVHASDNAQRTLSAQ